MFDTTMAKKESLSLVEARVVSCMWFIRGAATRVALFQQERQVRMKDKSTLVKYTREELTHVADETDWEKVDAMSDEEVYQDALNDKDAQPTDKTFWETAPLPSHLMNIDPDLLKWFKSRTVDCETQINTVLRSYVEANKQCAHTALSDLKESVLDILRKARSEGPIQLEEIRQRLGIPKVDYRDTARSNSLVWGILCHLHDDGYVRHTPRIGWEITEVGRTDENAND